MGGTLKKFIERLQSPIEIDNNRLAAVVILLGLLLTGLFLIFYPPLVFQEDARRDLDRLRSKLNQARRTAALKEPLKERLDSIKALSSNNEAFLPTTTPALASAELQTRIKQVVNESGGELASTQAIAEKPEENIVRVGVKVRLAGSTAVLRAVLHTFESGKPSLFIDNLNIRPIRAPGRPGEAYEDRLSADFDVIGYMQTPSGS